MRRILLALAVSVLVLPAIPQAKAETDVSINFFYDNLGANDGNWLEVEDYGYCWQPSVAVSNANWRPYADGYWAYTDVGWTWVSYEDFGWATYHYGRWARLRDHGWVWVPGREWGPAWVSWRTGGDYVGWAPLPPRRHDGGGEVVYEGRPIHGQVDLEFDIGPAYYNFVDIRYIGEPVLRERIVSPAENITYITNTVNVTNITYNNSTVYNYGPDYNRLSAYSTRPIQRLKLERENNVDLSSAARSGALTKVQGNTLMVAAPREFKRAERTIAPKSVKAKIAKPNIETGWSNVSDPKAKADLQAKMKSEDPKSVPPTKLQPQNPAALQEPSPTPIAGSSATPAASPGATTAATMPPTPAPATTPNANEQDRARGRSREQKAQTPAASVSPPNESTPSATDRQGKRGQPDPRQTPESAQQDVTPKTAASATPPRQADEEKRRGRKVNPVERQTPGAKREATPAGQDNSPDSKPAGNRGVRKTDANPSKPEDQQNDNAARLRKTQRPQPEGTPNKPSASVIDPPIRTEAPARKERQQAVPQREQNAAPAQQSGREEHQRGEKKGKRGQPEPTPGG